MSYHIRLEEYNCPSCNALYIPYKINIPCPNCKKIPDNVPREYLSFIDDLITSLRINKIRNGKYLPNAWYIGSFVEYIQSVIFNIFDRLDISKTSEVEMFVNEYLDSTEWDKNIPYGKDYIHSIFLEIYSRKNELSVSLWTKLIFKLLP